MNKLKNDVKAFLFIAGIAVSVMVMTSIILFGVILVIAK